LSNNFEEKFDLLKLEWIIKGIPILLELKYWYAFGVSINKLWAILADRNDSI